MGKCSDLNNTPRYRQHNMPCLIILRGPPAVGKTTTKDDLLTKLGEDVAFLHLDIIESEYDLGLYQYAI